MLPFKSRQLLDELAPQGERIAWWQAAMIGIVGAMILASIWFYVTPYEAVEFVMDLAE